MKNVIIFGAAGFIGTNLTKHFLENGDKVLAFDNFSTSDPLNISQFDNYLLDNQFYFVQADIVNNISTINEYIKYFYFNEQVDEIYNLACPASPPKYQATPIHTLDTCIAVKNICEIALDLHAKLLHASTSEIYGDPLQHPQPEEYRGNVNTIGPRSCYDEGKRVAETYCYEYRKLGLDVKLIRIFNTYGPYMNPEDGRVVSNFIMQALRNEDITIYGDGLQTRSFQYIDDLIKGMLKIMQSDSFGPFNVGNPGEFTMIELAEKVLKYIPESTSKLVYRDLPKDDPTKRKPNIEKIYNELGWLPQIILDEGLQKTIEYFKTKL
jgi:UDP-glucuronate decarboxylase